MKVRFADIETLHWDPGTGLLPAIVQHATSGAVLMLAYMNRESLRATLDRQRAVFFSRSRQRLWEKGESSGHTLHVTDVRRDCDSDTLLVAALPAGPVCHLGTTTCFGEEPVSAAERLAFLAELERIIDERIAANPDGSYTAQLYARGVRRMAQKVGEEGVEVALAGAGEPAEQLTSEAADLLFHLMLLLRARQLSMRQVVEELHQRHADRAPGASQEPTP